MKLDSIREIKNHFLNPTTSFNIGVARSARPFPKSIALGLSAGGKLAVRCYGVRNQQRVQQAFVEMIMGYTKNEAEVQFLEMPMAYGAMSQKGWWDKIWGRAPKEKLENQGRCRPLKIGWSVGHYQITCGSTAARVEYNGSDRYFLSNSHILALSNDAKINDPILQPGKHDGGSIEKDLVARLAAFVKINKEHNKVDAAIAKLEDGIEFDPSTLGSFGKYAGDGDGELEVGQPIKKFGRTTGATFGVVSALEMDGVRVNYGGGRVYSFDNQIEVRGTKETPQYSDGGDSGSLCVDNQNKGIGLLFAGGNGGEGHRTYCNDLQDVLKALKIRTVK